MGSTLQSFETTKLKVKIMSMRQIETLDIGKGGYKMRMTGVSNLLDSHDLPPCRFL